MAKRLTDANKWDDPWYQDLSADNKLAWDYITSKCDSVGVWKPSERSLKFYVSANASLSDLLKLCGEERIFIMPNGNWWLIKFCDFQYGTLLEDSKSQTTISYIKLLKKHSLWEAYMKGIYRVSNTPKDKDKEKDEEEYKEEEKEKPPQLEFKGLVYPFDSENFKVAWVAWKNHLRECKKPMQTFSSEQAGLQFLSQFTEQHAIDLIKNCIKNNWKNLIDDKKDGKQGNKNSGKAGIDGVVELAERMLNTNNSNYDQTGS